MKTLLRNLLSALLSLSLAAPAAFAQDEASPEFTQAELDQMLAPIALYPDALLSQILMAATYPLEIVQAARWSKANSGLQGDAAVRAVDSQEWDPSVKSLVAFPQILSMMDEKLDWTGRLGDAFLAQPEQVMDSVQGLRQKAHAAGNLKTNEHTRVEHQAQTIIVTSAYPDVVYVPYYDPFVVYGPWWWPAYRPVYWAPWPGYYARPGVVFHWSIGIHIGHGFFFGHWDWRARHVRVVDVRPFYYKRVAPPRHVWVHEHQHRRGVPYRHVSVHNKYVKVVNTPSRRYDDGKHTRPEHDGRKKIDERTDRREHAKRTTEVKRESWRREADRAAPRQAEHSQGNNRQGDRGKSGGGAADAPGRVRAPVERVEIRRPDMPGPAVRPDPPARDAREPMRTRGDEHREREPRNHKNPVKSDTAPRSTDVGRNTAPQRAAPEQKSRSWREAHDRSESRRN